MTLDPIRRVYAARDTLAKISNLQEVVRGLEKLALKCLDEQNNDKAREIMRVRSIAGGACACGLPPLQATRLTQPPEHRSPASGESTQPRSSPGTTSRRPRLCKQSAA